MTTSEGLQFNTVMDEDDVVEALGLYKRDGTADVEKARAVMRNAGQIRFGRRALTTRNTVITFIEDRIAWAKENNETQAQAVTRSDQGWQPSLELRQAVKERERSVRNPNTRAG